MGGFDRFGVNTCRKEARAMRERKFTADEIRDVVFALVGDTGIYGETYADAKNTENIKTLFDLTLPRLKPVGFLLPTNVDWLASSFLIGRSAS